MVTTLKECVYIPRIKLKIMYYLTSEVLPMIEKRYNDQVREKGKAHTTLVQCLFHQLLNYSPNYVLETFIKIETYFSVRLDFKLKTVSFQ